MGVRGLPKKEVEARERILPVQPGSDLTTLAATLLRMPSWGVGVISVLLVEDQNLVRSGLRALLDREEGIHIIGEAADGEEAIQMACDLRPDLRSC